MKTKFDISNCIFDSHMKLEEGFDYYNECYKSKGFILNKEDQEVYKIFDKEIHLKEGDRVFLEGYAIVSWKCINIDDDMIEYIIEDE